MADQFAIAIRVETVADLRRGLENASRPFCFGIIEAITGFHDPSPVNVKYMHASAKRAEPRSGARAADF